MKNLTSHANSQYGLNRTFGVIPDGCNAFTMHSKPVDTAAHDLELARKRKNNAAKREKRKGMSKEQIAALALRSDAERKADRAAAVVKLKPKNGFNTPIEPVTRAGSSKAARTSRAAI